MKNIFLAFLFLLGCASAPNDAQYKEEKNQAKFGNTRSFVEPPEDVLLAARAVLDDLSRQSDPPTTASLKGNDESVETGWVYSQSKDKYVEYKFNGTPRRKALKIRRKYTYSVTPSLAGSQVLLGIEEDIMKVNLKTGQDDGWSSVEPDPQAYDQMSRMLVEKLRTR